jgi:hypothetical protein
MLLLPVLIPIQTDSLSSLNQWEGESHFSLSWVNPMTKIHLPKPFSIKNDLREITVNPIEATFDSKLIVIHCELYVGQAKIPAFHECFNVPTNVDTAIEKNPLAYVRFIQLKLNQYFSDVYPKVIQKYFPEKLPQHQ